jgi:putative Ca2+/H+ antiporter (TMEM165/GDT1 family)
VSPAVIVATFVAVFLAELPDKTMFATMVLSARYGRPRVVWAGVALAFVIQVAVAVTAGGLLSRLPQRAVAVAAGVLFAAGAVVLLREGDEPAEDELGDDLDEELTTPGPPRRSGRQIFLRTFGVVFVAELGDLTQLATAGLAARTGQPVAVFVGAVAALWCAGGVAVVAGHRVLSRLPVVWVRRVAAGIFAVLSVLAFGEAARS